MPAKAATAAEPMRPRVRLPRAFTNPRLICARVKLGAQMQVSVKALASDGAFSYSFQATSGCWTLNSRQSGVYTILSDRICTLCRKKGNFGVRCFSPWTPAGTAGTAGPAREICATAQSMQIISCMDGMAASSQGCPILRLLGRDRSWHKFWAPREATAS